MLIGKKNTRVNVRHSRRCAVTGGGGLFVLIRPVGVVVFFVAISRMHIKNGFGGDRMDLGGLGGLGGLNSVGSVGDIGETGGKVCGRRAE